MRRRSGRSSSRARYLEGNNDENDGSGWQGVYKLLRKDGYTVRVVQNPHDFPLYFRDFVLSSSNQFSTTISLSGVPVRSGRIIKKRRSSRATAYCGAKRRDENPAAGKSATERPSENVGFVCFFNATGTTE